ncbi:MAG: ADP-ribosylglycohydrolase family protein [bacterium]|nr:ADP-ribosylglycohydrolase family protein [bacterium]
MLSSDLQARLARARTALEGLSVGDAFGELFFWRISHGLLMAGVLPDWEWKWTDDTNMALSVYAVLRQHHEIVQDVLIKDFARRYDSGRGYGPAMHDVLRRIAAGEPWQPIVGGLFSGQGSYGNGTAMRIAPLGAYFADDLEHVVEQARLSAEVTHTHPEGIAGGIATAVAAAFACRWKEEGVRPSRREVIEAVIPYVPESEVRSGLHRTRDLAEQTHVAYVGAMLGNGSLVSSQDTVPFALWCVGDKLDKYEEALWMTASVGGDVDTNCAIVGGIVACYTGAEAIPAAWRKSREPLPAWAINT